MKKMKRFVSWMIVLATLAASCAFAASVSAEDAAAGSSVEVTEADKLIVEKLEAFGAITNEYEDIGMYVTRRQMTDIIITYLRMQSSDVAAATSPFLDVPLSDPDIGKIAALYQAGIITGDENLRFHPDDNLTYDEAIVFVVNAVGHKLFAAREGGYPTGYHRIAIKHDMLEGLKFQSGKEYIPLCDVYKMLESALDVGAVVPQVFSDGSVDYKVSQTETYLSDMYNIVEYKGIVTGTEYTHLDTHLSNLTDEQVAIDKVTYDTPGYVYATSLGRSVYYYIRKTASGEYDVAYVEENNKINHVVQVSSKDLIIDKATRNRIFYEDENGKERHIDLKDQVPVIYNNKFFGGYGRIADVLPEYGYIEALDNTGDEVADVLFVYEYDNIVVGAVDTYEEVLTAMYTNEEFPLDMQQDIINIRLMPDNKRLNLNTLKQWDVASVMKSESDPAMYTIYVSRNTISGTVEEINSELGYLINGTYYEPAPGGLLGDEVSIGMSAMFYLDFNGKIACVDSGAVVNENESYAVVTGLDYDMKSATAEVKVKLYTQEGTFLEAPLKNSVNIDGTRYSSTGADMSAVLQLLSNGATDASGNYIVDSAYVVRYALSDGAISYLDTDRTGVNDKLNKFAEGTSFLVRNNILALDSVVAGTTTTEQKYANFKANEVYVFMTPSDGNLGETKEYAVQRTLRSSIYYRPSGNYTVPIDEYAAYNTGTGEYDTAEVVLLRGGSSSSIIAVDSAFNVVTKITGAVDAEGNATKKLYLNEAASVLAADVVSVKVGDADSAAETDVPAAQLGDHIKPGMVIQYGKNEDGLMNSVQIMTSYDPVDPDAPDVKTITKHFTKGVAIGSEIPSSSGRNYAVGEVVYIDTADNIMLVAVQSGTGASITTTESMVNLSNASVVVYRDNRETATTGTVGAITAGDKLVMRISSFVNVQDIIVFK